MSPPAETDSGQTAVRADHSVAESTTDIPIVFIVGTGRCGSSLVQEALSRHPSIGFLSNFDDRFGTSGRWNQMLYATVPQRLTMKGRMRFAPSEGYRLLDREVSPLISRTCRDLTEADVTPWLRRQLAAAFARRYRAQRSALFLHKLTGWPRARFLKEVFPRARFIHVVRDGRAVANSLLQMPWWHGWSGPDNWRLGPLPGPYLRLWERHDRSFVVLAGLYWRILMDAHEDAQWRMGGSGGWTTVRYEDLVVEPQATLSSLLDWVGLDSPTIFARRIAAYRFSRGRSAAFRRDLTQQQLQTLHEVISPTLLRYGYFDHEVSTGTHASTANSHSNRS